MRIKIFRFETKIACNSWFLRRFLMKKQDVFKFKIFSHDLFRGSLDTLDAGAFNPDLLIASR